MGEGSASMPPASALGSPLPSAPARPAPSSSPACSRKSGLAAKKSCSEASPAPARVRVRVRVGRLREQALQGTALQGAREGALRRGRGRASGAARREPRAAASRAPLRAEQPGLALPCCPAQPLPFTVPASVGPLSEESARCWPDPPHSRRACRAIERPCTARRCPTGPSILAPGLIPTVAPLLPRRDCQGKEGGRAWARLPLLHSVAGLRARPSLRFSPSLRRLFVLQRRRTAGAAARAGGHSPGKHPRTQGRKGGPGRAG